MRILLFNNFGRGSDESFFGYIDDAIEKWRLPSADEILLRNKKGWKLLVKRTLRVKLV